MCWTVKILLSFLRAISFSLFMRMSLGMCVCGTVSRSFERRFINKEAYLGIRLVELERQVSALCERFAQLRMQRSRSNGAPIGGQ